MQHAVFYFVSVQACVIYRDFYNGPQVLETHDFVEKQNFEELTSFLSSVHAISNTDPCENVAGGLKVRRAVNTC